MSRLSRLPLEPGSLSRALPLVAVAVIACSSDGGPDLETQVDDPDQRAKIECVDVPEPAFQPVAEVEDSLSLEVVDCGFALPTRLRFASSGDILLVAQLKGVLDAYVLNEADEWVHQTLHDLGELGVRDEAGLTSMFFGVGFDLDAADPAQRDVFLTYQALMGRATRNVIRRITLTRQEDRLVAENPVDIWIASDTTGQAHQIQDGFGLMHEGEPHILVAVGDGNSAENARDPGAPNGTLQLLRRDGSPPSGARPWSQHPTTAAIGLRNTYSLLRLPSEIDPREGVIGLENGNDRNDRAWLVRLQPPSGGTPAQLDLGYTGNDEAASWLEFGDPHTPSALGGQRTAVFRTFSPPVSPTGAALHPGRGIIPESGLGQANVVVAFFGISGSTAVTPGKTIDRITVSNIDGAAIQSDRQTLIERRPETEGQFHHPVGLDVDPTNGDIWFADIISGTLNRVRILVDGED